MPAHRFNRTTGALGLGLLIVPLLGLARFRPPSLPASTAVAALPPAHSPSEAARREARRYWVRAQQSVNDERERLEEWDPAATQTLNQEAWRRQLTAADAHGHLHRALEAGRRAAALARTREEAAAAAGLLAHLECEAGHHETELEQARKLMALQPGSPVAQIELRHAAICNHLAPLAE